MTTTTFEDLYDYFAPKMDGTPVHNDFMTVMDWLADRPGELLSFGDLAKILTGGNLDADALERVVPVSIVMTTWSRQVADVVFMVKDSGGRFHEVPEVDPAQLEGKRPFVIADTGEVIECFLENAYPHLRVRNFEPRATPALAIKGPTP
jgi:hypothetical protein